MPPGRIVSTVERGVAAPPADVSGGAPVGCGEDRSTMRGEPLRTTPLPRAVDPREPGFCRVCTLHLVEEAYRRAPWFRLVREPLRLGMVVMARLMRLAPPSPGGRAASCAGCPRYLKVGLKRRSALFRRLNDWVNPHYDAMLERLVAPGEHERARERARETAHGPDTERTP